MITLKTLPLATAQEVFEQVANHLLTQNQQSSLNSNCLYRGADNLKCAAGCLIGDDEYTPEFDTPGKGVGSGWISLATRNLVPNNHQRLISELQHLHDTVSPTKWKDHLKHFSITHNLNTDFIQ